MDPTPLPPSSTLARSLVVLAYLWIGIIVIVTQFSGWLLPVFDANAPYSRTNALLTLLASGLIAGPLVVLVFRLRSSRARAALRIWLCAALFPLLLAVTRLIPPAASQLTIAAQVVGCGLLALGLWLWQRHKPAPNPAGLALGAGMGGLCALPWLLIGVPGSPLDVLLALLLGAFVGITFGQLARIWFAASAERAASRIATIGIGGFVLGAALLIMASSLSTNGVQIGLLLALPALGWVAAALGYAQAAGTGGQQRCWLGAPPPRRWQCSIAIASASLRSIRRWAACSRVLVQCYCLAAA